MSAPADDVLNQPPLRGDLDLWTGDPVLRDHAGAAGADAAHLAALGPDWGRLDMREAGRTANRVLPELNLIDRGGRRLDEVIFHPAYHQLLGAGLKAGYAAIPWEGATGGHATHAAMVYLMSQIEPGVCCPMTMTYAANPALGADDGLAGRWRPKLTARDYDGSVRPLAEKPAATIGMAMTEKQGGSDVRANITTATPDGDGYRLNGHKWFCSAPMCDGFLTLAQAPGGLTCFVVPRWLEDGRNGIRIQRLKDKLGNRANASSEIEYHHAWAERLGGEGEGVKTIIEMVHHTRLDTAMAPAGLMRAALDEAHWWVNGRSAFQKRLIDAPLMRAVLADLVLDWEAATALGFRVAAAFDDPGQRAFARLAVAIAKFASNKRAPLVIYEAMEVLGGMGFVEDTPLPLLYREAPLNSIWEGSGNVICLDILRTLARAPEAGEALTAELTSGLGADRRYDQALKAFQSRWPKGPDEAEARAFVETLGHLLAAACLLKSAPGPVADAFIATRLEGQRGHVHGSHALGDPAPILGRLGPA